MTAARSRRKPRRPAEDEVSVTDDLRALNDGPAPFGGDYAMMPPPQPSFTPAPLPPPPPPAVAETGAQPALTAGPLDPWVPEEPLLPAFIGDSIPPPPPLPVHEPEPEPEPGTDTVLYSQPGWAWLPTAQRTGEAEEIDLIVERGLGRNASAAATAFRHSRKRIADGTRQLCADVRQPELAGMLLRRVRDYNEQAKRERAARRSGPQQAVRGSGPQPAVPAGGRHARQPGQPGPAMPALSHLDLDKVAGRMEGRRAS